MERCNQPDDAWIVERIEENEDGTAAVLHVSQNTSYQAEQKWPQPGQRLVVKEGEE